MTTMMMHLNDPVPDLRQIQPGTPPELVAIIEKALAKNRSQRYASAAEMSTALRKILDRMYSAAAGATLVSEAMPPETTMPAEPLGATLKASGAGQVSPVPLAASPVESEPALAEATMKAAGVAVAAGAAAAPPAGQAPTVMTPAGSGTPPPPPVSTPQTYSAGGEPPKKRTISPAMLAGGAATILILLVIIFVAGQNLLGGNNDTPPTEPAATLPAAGQETTAPTQIATATNIPPTNTPPPTATTKPSATPTTAPTPTETPSTEPYVEITGITVLKDNYSTATNFVIDYKTENFTESRTGYHIHFFFDTVPPDQAGMPGYGPWELYYGPSPFKPANQMKLQNRPAQATQICALVANKDHSLYYPASGELTTGNCWNIPPY
jgi:serine/threonine-protein kinase